MTTNSPIGCSAPQKALLAKLAKLAQTDAEVLISGASGTGKELYARYLHEHSNRATREFVPVNCGTLGGDLLENVLFGHVGGAYTSANSSTTGLVQLAEGGTLFLDEVDSLSIPCQIKLLRFLQDGEYRRLGEANIRRADVRIIAATNSDLLDAIEKGRFRSDLYFRLRVVPITVPTLWDRPEDIELMVQRFLEDSAREYGLPKAEISKPAMAFMRQYAWPGNVRELQNCIRYLTCLQLEMPAQPEDLPLLERLPGQKSESEQSESVPTAGNPVTGQPLKEAKREVVAEFERRYIENVLRRAGGNISRAAKMSGKARRAFFELMRKHEIHAERFKNAAG